VNSRGMKRTQNTLDVDLAGAWGPVLGGQPPNSRDLSHLAINRMFFEGASMSRKRHLDSVASFESPSSNCKGLRKNRFVRLVFLFFRRR